MAILLTLAVIIGIGAAYVLLPVGLSVFADFRKPKGIICPEDGKPADILVDAAYAAMTSAVGASRLRLKGCTRWPEHAACDQSCVSQVAH